MSVLPPNPSLVAIIVLIKTKQGVKHVYHYPRFPGRDASTIPSRFDEDNDNHSSDSDVAGCGYSSSSSESPRSSIEDYNSSGSDYDSSKNIKSNKKRLHNEKDDASINESGSTSPEKNVLNNWRAAKGHKELLGLPPGFPAFLCPPNELDRRRFEIVIDQLTFVGWPCFAKEDGTWKRKKKKRESEGRTKDDVRSSSALGSTKRSTNLKKSNEDTKVTAEAGLNQDEGTETEAGETSGIESGYEATNETANGITTSIHERAIETEPMANLSVASEQTLSMFHIVFVMNPPPLEYHTRVDDMYIHVVKPFSKALKREQARSNYVWKECERLKAMKARHGT